LPRVSQPLTVGLIAGIIAQTALPLGFIVVSGSLVGSIPVAVRSGMSSPAGRHTLMLLAAAALLIAAQRVIIPLAAAQAGVFGRRVDRYLQQRVMAAVGRPTHIGHLENPAVLDLIQTAQGVGTQDIRPGTAVDSLSTLIPSWLLSLGSCAILIGFRWWLGIGWLLLWPVVLYYLQREYIRVGQAASDQAALLRRAGYLRDLALTPPAAKETRVWGLSDWLVGRYSDAWAQVMRPIWEMRNPGRRVVWLSALAVLIANVASYGLLASAAAHGEISLAALAVYLQATVTAASFRSSDDANMNLAYAAVAMPSVLALEEQLADAGTSGAAPLAAESPRAAIRFEGVSFHYPGADRPTIDGLDLTIPARQSLAIVGVNGAGKTTLVKLLCRLYEPSSGRITVDGIDLRDIDPPDWHRRVAAIFQDFTRYHLSVRDNIAMGALDLVGDQRALERAARRAGALSVIEGFSGGWDSILSRQYTGGVDPSGGQWQRIALARALFAVEAGARMLVLDEPTANLDVRAEAEIYDRFLDLTAGLTTILISHRFSTVRRANRIVVLERGRITEQGTHEELMRLGGRYAEMFHLQAERFMEESV
jgi:ATP-binding cassette subfamily B protein